MSDKVIFKREKILEKRTSFPFPFFNVQWRCTWFGHKKVEMKTSNKPDQNGNVEHCDNLSYCLRCGAVFQTKENP